MFKVQKWSFLTSWAVGTFSGRIVLVSQLVTASSCKEDELYKIEHNSCAESMSRHIRIMTDVGVVVLQNCMDVPKLVPDSCGETCQTSLCDGNEGVVVKVEDGADIQEEKDPLLIHEVSREGVLCAHAASFPFLKQKLKRHIPNSVVDSVACVYKKVSHQILS
jgi:hypothetical protein